MLTNVKHAQSAVVSAMAKVANRQTANGESPNTVANRQVANRQGLLAFIPLSARTREARSVGRGIRSLDDQPHRLRNVRVASNEAENADSIFKHSYH